MSHLKPTYEELEQKVISLESELKYLKTNQTDEKFHNFIKHTPNIFYIYSSIKGGIYWSEKVKDILGFETEELRTNPFLWNHSIHPDDQIAVQKAIEEDKKGKNFNIEYRIQTKWGNWIWLHDEFIHKTKMNEEVIIEGLATDITSKKNTELILREREELIRNYINSTSDIVYTLDTQQRHTEIFGDWAERAGFTKSFFIGRSPKEILGENYKNHETANEKALQGERVIYQWEVVQPEKTSYFQTSLSPLFNKGKVYGLIGVGRNITKLIEKEKALEESKKTISKQNLDLLKLNADKDRFISMLAHDLRNPILGIRELLEILSKNIRTYKLDEIEQIMLLASQSTNAFYQLLEDLLLWAMSQSGNFLFDPIKINVYNICTEILAVFQLSAQNKDIVVNISIDQNLDIFADKNMVFTILRNLLSNAIKFTSKNGQINLTAKRKDLDIELKVEDNGIGMDAEKLNTLFDISKIKTSRGTENEKGNGLGLLLCKDFIEKHKGNIWVKSEVGKGSQFIFTLPVYLENKE